MFLGKAMTSVAQLDTFNAAKFSTEKIAVVNGDDLLTYGQLHCQSLAIAKYLQKHFDVQPGDRIGLCIDRGLALPIALVSVLRAGAAYVPLDPSFPTARLQFMVKNSDCRILISCRAHTALFTQTNRPCIDIEDLLSEASNQAASADDQILEVDPESLAQMPAYIIYTSGSTGQPKGVELPHRALDNLIAWHNRQTAFTGECRTLQFTPVSFDVHFQEFFVTWAAGGTVVMIDDELRRDPLSLLKFIVDQSITHLYLPFIVLQQLAEIAMTYGPIPDSLEEIVSAGEQLQINRCITSFFEQLPNVRLHNHYGPSETHVVTTFTLLGHPAKWPTIPPIGKPIENVELVILDNDGQPVQVGEVGELYIAGVCLATGYCGMTELTTEKFRTLPLCGNNQRYYATGDLARQFPDNNYQYLGRIDSQVKIRGYRVEVGEVEAVIIGHPAVREVAVNAQRNKLGEQSLAAYLIPNEDQFEQAASQNDQLTQWRDVWDGTYIEPSVGIDPKMDFCGWNSSYTGKPLPKQEMSAWVQATVERILSLNPKRVLEIGCGTGLILHNLAPYCEQYVGTDFSTIALQRLQDTIDQRGDELKHVNLLQCSAHEIGQFKVGKFDCIVMNSVTQHFPSANYLIQVLKQCIDLLAYGGILFVGDVTNKLTREMFFTSIATHYEKSDSTLSNIRAVVQQRLGNELELVIEPAFFFQLPDSFDHISNVRTLLKRGDYRNELGDFRYDAIIKVGTSKSASSVAPNSLVVWEEAGLESANDLEQWLSARPESVIGVLDIPNRRVQRYQQCIRLICDNPDWTKQELITALSKFDTAGVEPNTIWMFAERCGYHVDIVSRNAADRYDAYFIPTSKIGEMESLHYWGLTGHKPLRQCTSLPLGCYVDTLTAELRSALTAKLPEYMVPGRFVVLSQMPTTPTGKLDRRALPVPSRKRPALREDYVAPRTEMQQSLAKIWGETLDLDEVGVMDSFFELGGNSILSLRVVMKVKEYLGLDLPVAYFFQHPTIKALEIFLDSDKEQSIKTLKDASSARAAKQKAAFVKIHKSIKKCIETE